MPDPRSHRHVRRVAGDRLTYVCGCINAIDGPSGVLKAVAKCASHRAEARETGVLGQAYYEHIEALKDGIPQTPRYLDEMAERMGAEPPLAWGERALEIGAGVSMYAGWVQRLGYRYQAVEPSPWAAAWLRNTYLCTVHEGPFETFAAPPDEFSLILAAHSLEHMADAPGAVEKCAGLLKTGGELWAIVPDDRDPLNPDHLWFFSAETLRSTVEAAGLAVACVHEFPGCEMENFLYLRAVKP